MHLLKPIIIVIFSLCTRELLLSQSLFEQALKLRAYVSKTKEGGQYYLSSDGADVTNFMNILGPVVGAGSSASMVNILDSLKKNPFLGRTAFNAKVVIPEEYLNTRAKFKNNMTYQQPPRSSGGMSVTTLSDGLAKFFVTRTKQELSIVFFEKFQKAIRDDKRIQALFPATANILNTIGEKVYDFDNYLNDLRVSFDKDMRVVPENLKHFIQTSDVVKDPFRQVVAEDLLDVTQFLMNKTSPDSIIGYLATDAAIQRTYRIQQIKNPTDSLYLIDLGGRLKMLNLISESLRSQETGKIWVNRALLESGLYDEATLYIYLGLLWQKGEAISFGKGQNFRDLLSATTKYDELRNIMRDYCEYGQQIANSLKFKQPQNTEVEAGTVPYEPYYQFFSGVTGLFETGLQFKLVMGNMVGENTKRDTMFLKGLRGLNDLNFDVRQRFYTAAINDLVAVLDALLPAEKFTFRAPLIRYGRFIANVAEAENSDEVAAAIDAIALPPGSARLKKASPFSVSLNGYTGLAGGRERLELTKKEAFTGALSAPIGFAFNLGRNKRSYSLYLPVIDVGALVAFRFKDATASNLPELDWSNLFSPGAYFVWGFHKKWPFVIGLGGQRGPNLRKIDNVNFPDIKTDSGWRLGGFFSVDIPVFNLFAR